jgi:hypothetical protein
MGSPLAALLLLAAVAACSTGGAPLQGTTNGTSGGCGTPTAACDISSQAWMLATDAGTDCGSIDFSDNAFVTTDAGAVVLAVSCALGAQDAGEPFVLLMTSSGIDTASESAYVRAPDGGSFLLTQFISNCQPAELDAFPCTSFVRQEIPPSVNRTDGGLPGIACDGQGTAICVCLGKAC